jgi:uncharacterized membrane protein
MKRIALIGCLLAIAGGTALRFWNLSDQPYHNDEAWTALWLSGHNVTEMRNDLCGRVSTSQELQRYLAVTPEKGVRAAISSVAADDPKHGPVYFALLRFWLGVVGDSSGAQRAFSAILGLLAIPAAFFLARDLFESRFTGMIAAALVAASPLHILYSQDIRPYSLLVTMTLFSSWVLLTALRTNTRAAWVGYAASVIAGLYSHPLFLLAIGSHSVYLALRLRSEHDAAFWRDSRLARFVRALLGAALAFLPWMVIFLTVRRTNMGLGWLVGRASLRYLARSWASVWSHTFVDLTELRVARTNLIYAGIAISLCLVFLHLWRRSGWKKGGLAISLLAVPLLLFIPADVVLGIQSSTVDRYWLTGLIGAELAVAFGLASATESVRALPRTLGAILLGAVLTGGLYSSWLNLKAGPWIKGLAREYRVMGPIVNQADRPLLVCDCTTIVRLLSFSPFLDADVEVALVRPEDQSSLDASREAFLFRHPSGSELDGKLQVVQVPGSEQEWRVIRS